MMVNGGVILLWDSTEIDSDLSLRPWIRYVSL